MEDLIGLIEEVTKITDRRDYQGVEKIIQSIRNCGKFDLNKYFVNGTFYRGICVSSMDMPEDMDVVAKLDHIMGMRIDKVVALHNSMPWYSSFTRDYAKAKFFSGINITEDYEHSYIITVTGMGFDICTFYKDLHAKSVLAGIAYNYSDYTEAFFDNLDTNDSEQEVLLKANIGVDNVSEVINLL